MDDYGSQLGGFSFVPVDHDPFANFSSPSTGTSNEWPSANTPGAKGDRLDYAPSVKGDRLDAGLPPRTEVPLGYRPPGIMAGDETPNEPWTDWAKRQASNSASDLGTVAGNVGEFVKEAWPYTVPGLMTAPLTGQTRPPQQWADTAAHIASMPVRMATQGEYGIGDIANAPFAPYAPLTAEANRQKWNEAERSFAEQNPSLVKGEQVAGDIGMAAGMPRGHGYAGMGDMQRIMTQAEYDALAQKGRSVTEAAPTALPAPETPPKALAAPEASTPPIEPSNTGALPEPRAVASSSPQPPLALEEVPGGPQPVDLARSEATGAATIPQGYTLKPVDFMPEFAEPYVSDLAKSHTQTPLSVVDETQTAIAERPASSSLDALQMPQEAPKLPAVLDKSDNAGMMDVPSDQPTARNWPTEAISSPGKVDTPEFKNWFGGSAVVDEAGKPRIVYHGTARGDISKGIQEFDTYGSNYGLMGQGGYFTESPEIASEYTRKGLLNLKRKGSETPQSVYPTYLSIKNPIDMDAPPNLGAWAKAYQDYVSPEELSGVKTNEQAYRIIEENLSDEMVPSAEGAEIVQDGLRSMGHDGITHIGGGRVNKDGPRHRVWIAFDPEQIKSIYNRGTFDPEDPHISYAIRAYHGSPHDFERFDSSKIGAGEGAQVFGHGLYFAQEPGVAKSYQLELAGRAADPRAVVQDMLPDLAKDEPSLSGMLYQSAINGRRSAAEEAAAIQSRSPALRDPGSMMEEGPIRKRLAAAIDALREKKQGHLYEVSLDVEPHELLDWDKPISEQKPILDGIKKARLPVPTENMTGGDFIRSMTSEMDPAETSRFLSEAGVPGIRYLDQGSRTSGEGTHNVVMFDDSKVRITHKNGEPVSTAERQQAIKQMYATRGQDTDSSSTNQQDYATLGKPDNGGVANEQYARTGADTGRKSITTAPGQPEAVQSFVSGEGRPAAGLGVGNAGLRDRTQSRIVRQESASLAPDGSIIAGRPSKKARTSGKSRQGQPTQRPGTVEPFDIPGFEGRVTAAELSPRDVREGNLARLNYGVSDMDGNPTAGMEAVQHHDGAWEVEFVESSSPGKGVGSKLYNAVEKDLGIRMSPSGVLSDDGLAFWRKRSPESVKWHIPFPAWEGLNVSPAKVDREISRVGKELAALTKRTGKAASMDPALRDELIQSFKQQRGALIKAWMKFPKEAREAKGSMFALPGTNGGTAGDILRGLDTTGRYEASRSAIAGNLGFLRANRTMVPDGITVGTVKSILKTASGQARVTYVDINGKESHVDMPPNIAANTLGLFDPRSRSVFVHGLSSFGSTPHGPALVGKSAALLPSQAGHERGLIGILGHESFHAAASLDYIPDAVFANLVSHAENLHIMDMPVREFARLSGAPDWKSMSPGTIRDQYHGLYHETPEMQVKFKDDHQAIIREEAAAHLVELYHYVKEGAKSGDPEMVEKLKDFAPVARDLDRFYTGEFKTKGRAASGSREAEYKSNAFIKGSLRGKPYSRAGGGRVSSGRVDEILKKYVKDRVSA